jgi:hypothetical protein
MNHFHGRKIENALNQAATLTATTNGNTIDRQGYGLADFVIQVGTSTTADGSNYFTISLEHGDASNMSDAAAVTAANGLVGANLVINATADANLVNHLGYNGIKRYVRCVATETGTASVQIAAVAVLSEAARQAVSNASIAS